jgi:Lrp/AsnC family transcriptional regulator, regulator for asnA, asnC and gidA
VKTGIRNTPINLEDFAEIDEKIIKYLQKNGRESFAKIGEEIGVPASTVRDRTNRLVENGTLRIVAVLNPSKVGQQVMANIGVKLSGGNHRTVANEIAKFDEVSYLVICAGSFDLLVEAICRDNTHLLEFTSALQSIPGVLSTETFIYYTIVKEIFDLGSL